MVINLGTNDNSPLNHVTKEAYVDGYSKLIQGVHGKYPKAQIIAMVRYFRPNSAFNDPLLSLLSLPFSPSHDLAYGYS